VRNYFNCCWILLRYMRLASCFLGACVLTWMPFHVLMSCRCLCLILHFAYRVSDNKRIIIFNKIIIWQLISPWLLSRRNSCTNSPIHVRALGLAIFCHHFNHSELNSMQLHVSPRMWQQLPLWITKMIIGNISYKHRISKSSL
jgi:hypothetical protein